MAEFYLAASGSGSWYCACWLCHSLLVHLNVITNTCVFLMITSQNVCFEKDLLCCALSCFFVFFFLVSSKFVLRTLGLIYSIYLYNTYLQLLIFGAIFRQVLNTDKCTEIKANNTLDIFCIIEGITYTCDTGIIVTNMLCSYSICIQAIL